ncbi:hypothetical protein DNHGIG_31970 [Collibacillus ludicampi]|uniref:Uncharacterized protein n=1 Tax=Collibacillus ludicampi TaxID=2771369 RepID=A0AAV4LIP2_9BACL|nr:hypothetical protein DNHGIG_31970 [Collibacillus ludicampi]
MDDEKNLVFHFINALLRVKTCEKRIERIEDQMSQLIRMMASIHRELVEIKLNMNQKLDQILEKLDNNKEL